MNFTPRTEEELEIANLVPKGIYDYQVLEAADKISKTNNEYISITLLVWDDEGREHRVFTNMALAKLLKHFCDVNNMQGEYKSGSIPAASFLNKSGGKVIIDIEGEKPKEGGGVYKAKNIVLDYIVAPPGSIMKPLPEVKKEQFDDELPF